MRRFAAATVLLACLMGVALAAPPTAVRPKTGGPSCTEPLTRVTCVLDSLSGNVMGIRYGIQGQTNDRSVCNAPRSGGAFFQQPVLPGGATNYFVNKVEVLRDPNAPKDARGKVPAIRWYVSDLTGKDLGFAVCGRDTEEAQGLFEVDTTFEDPLAADGEKRFLASFSGRCAKRNLVHDPTDATFFVTKLQKLCWAKDP